jgi:hypothetical protein
MDEIRNAGELLSIVKEISTWIKGEKYDSIQVECMNNVGIYSTTVNVDNIFSKWVQRLGKVSRKFDPTNLYDIRVYGLKPSPRKITEAVIRTEDGIVLDLNEVLKFDSFRIEFVYKICEDWLEGLVKWRSSPEPLQYAQKYHLSAQLKDPSSLTAGFSEFDIDEYPVTARVHIQEDINTNIPKYVTQMAVIEAEILADYDPHHALKVIGLQKRKAELKHKFRGKDLLSKVNDLSMFLRPTKFLSYIKLNPTEQYRLHDCAWGDDLFRALGMISLPKAMKVISRTDLSLRIPATSGELIYEQKKFSDDVKGFFEKKTD